MGNCWILNSKCKFFPCFDVELWLTQTSFTTDFCILFRSVHNSHKFLNVDERGRSFWARTGRFRGAVACSIDCLIDAWESVISFKRFWFWISLLSGVVCILSRCSSPRWSSRQKACVRTSVLAVLARSFTVLSFHFFLFHIPSYSKLKRTAHWGLVKREIFLNTSVRVRKKPEKSDIDTLQAAEPP